MTASPSLQLWYYVKITMVDLTDQTTATYYFSNRAIIDITNYGRYIPILREINGVGNRMDTYLPQTVTGSVVLSNAPHSFGYERRFGDLLDRQTPIGQTIECYFAKSAVDDLSLPGGFNLVWRSTVQTASLSEDGQTATINFQSDTIPRRVVTKVIDSDTFPDAPAASIGKHLPIVFGIGADVRPIVIEPDVQIFYTSSHTRAYATTLSTDFPVGGIDVVYIREQTSGEYLECVSSSDISTPTAVISQSQNDASSIFDLGFREMAYPLTGTLNYLVTGGRMRFGAGSGAAWTAGAESKLIFKLYRNDQWGVPDVLIAQGETLKSYYNANFSGTAPFWITWAFNKPAFLGHPYGYSLGFSQTNNETAGYGSTDLVPPLADSVASGQYYYIPYTAAGSNSAWVQISAGVDKKIGFELFACKFTDTTSSAGDSSGLGYASVLIEQPNGYICEGVDAVDMVFAVNGLQDDGSGTITGTPNANVQAPLHALLLLGREWDGANWVEGFITDDEYTSTHVHIATGGFLRYLTGATTGRTTLQQLLEAVCRNSLVRLPLYSNTDGALGIWAWGAETTPSFTLTDENSRVVRIEYQGPDTVVNYFKTFFDRTIRHANAVTGSAEGEFRDFDQSLILYDGSSDLGTALLARSTALFGARELATPTYEWLGDSASMQNTIRGLAAIYSLPHVYVVVDVPYEVGESIGMLDVGTIISPAMPAFFGTSSSAKLPTYNKSEVDVFQGAYPKRAKPTRVIVEGNEVNWNLDEYPTRTLTLRVLNNFPTDPT